MNADIRLMMNVNIKQTIAGLINEREVAQIMIRDMLREDKASEYDIARCMFWQTEYDNATGQLRALGIPVIA